MSGDAMTEVRQRRFIIEMLAVMIRELLVYRAFCEKAKADLGYPRSQEIDKFLNLVRNDSQVNMQLGPDFVTFVEAILQGPERDAGQSLDAFLREWTPQRAPN